MCSCISPKDISSAADNEIFKNRAQNIECSFGCVEQKFFQHGPIHFQGKVAQLCLWTKIRTKHWLVLGASAFLCTRAGFVRQFCLFTYPPRTKWAPSEKMVFFAKICTFCKSIAGPLPSVVQAYTQPYSFGERIHLIICQIRHEVSVTIYEINTRWKKNVRWRTHNKYQYNVRFREIPILPHNTETALTRATLSGVLLCLW